MKSFIKAIIIFNKDGEKRIVPLQQGVNIITGDSKTGKSALIEIIDYCLCSSRCTIPKGKITEFSYLYSLIITIGCNTYLIARYKWELGGKMHYFNVEQDISVDNVELAFIQNTPQLRCDDVKKEIEVALGLHVTNLIAEIDQGGKKASLRNMVSYLFQHQNLMASKFALFYRFNDFYKRKDTIEQFPIFAGIVGQEYYSDLIRLKTKEAELKQKINEKKANDRSVTYAKQQILPLLTEYYALLEQKFDKNLPLEAMLKMASNLPEFDDEKLFGETEIVELYNETERKFNELQSRDRELYLKIRQINNVSQEGDEFIQELENLDCQTKASKISDTKYKCPICGQDCGSIVEKDSKIVQAIEWLENELIITKRYTNNFSEDFRNIEESRKNIQKQIKEVHKQLASMKNKYFSQKSLLVKKEKAQQLKSKIEIFVEMNSFGVFKEVDDEIDEIQQVIKEIKERISRFDVDEKIKYAEEFLSNNMNRLAKTLDFEEEYRPINLHFGLLDSSFDLYHFQNYKEKIHLCEMGSGANWVSCHIVLFLSFLRYFASQKSSPMPLIMFFDQPSQVYFPQSVESIGKIEPKDLIAVNNMYQTIFDEINSIGNDTGVLPQIIVVDHVDGEKLDCKKEFENYVRCNWRNDIGLI